MKLPVMAASLSRLALTHTLALLLSLSLLVFLQQTNKSRTTMAEKQKQASKRVEGFQKSLSVGGVWAWRAT